jgi:hypothetical protein
VPTGEATYHAPYPAEASKARNTTRRKVFRAGTRNQAL